MRRLTLLSLLLAVWTVLGASPILAEKPQRGVAVTPAAPETVSIAGDYWALIIGIDQYRHDPEVPRLATAVRDAQAVREVLVQRYGFTRDHVLELINGQATRENIEDALFQLRKKAGADDSVFIYYAGHGQMDQEDQIGYWVPVEGKANKPGTYISNARIRDEIGKMKAKHVYLVADSCFSGSLFARGGTMPPINDKFFANMYKNRSRWGLTSGMNEPVSDEGKGGHSIFAYFFLKMLKENTDPYLVPSQIYASVGPLVGRNADQQPRSQALQNANDEGGQFVFRLASASGGPLPSAKPAMPSLSTPPVKDVDVSGYADLDAVARLAEKREAAWGTVQAFAGKTGVSKDKRLAAIEKFLSDFADDNPHASEAEALKQQITAEMVVSKAPAYEAPRQLEREITGKDGAPMVLISEGSFWMGSTEDEIERVVDECTRVTKKEDQCRGWFKPEQPRHQVTLDRFYLDVYETTNRLFEKFVTATGYQTTAEREGNAKAFVEGKGWQEVSGASWRQPEGGTTVMASSRREHPVVSVSWDDAAAYCRWGGKRLPTEAEWEYAARAGTQTRTWWGNGHPGSRRVANINDESAKNLLGGYLAGYDDGYARTAPVGSYEANPWGLHDIIGNAAEWTADWYGGYSGGQDRNPRGPSSGQYRVVRGGSWLASPFYVRSADRFGAPPAVRIALIGFRCAQDAH